MTDNPEGRRTLRLLIVDDNRDAADSLAYLARVWGHEARTNQRVALSRASGLEIGIIDHLLGRYGSLVDELLALIHRRPELGEPLRGAEHYLRAEVLYAVTPGTLEGDLMHDSSDDIATYLDRQNRYTTLAARQAFELGKSAGFLHLMLSPAVRFIKFYVLRLGFLDGTAGLLHISIGCMNSYMKYAKLLELKRAEGR